MSAENIEKFRETVAKDAALEKKIRNALMNAGPEDRVNVLKSFSEETGTPFTAEECRELIMQSQSVSDEELEMISGRKPDGSEKHDKVRDWLTSGCANSVEISSWCWSNDFCFSLEIKYRHKPAGKCLQCDGTMYLEDNMKYKKCIKCGAEELLPFVMG